jgi:hypothetical protein
MDLGTIPIWLEAEAPRVDCPRLARSGGGGGAVGQTRRRAHLRCQRCSIGRDVTPGRAPPAD